MAPSLFLAAQSVSRVIIVSDFLGDAPEILSVIGRLVAAGREAGTGLGVAGSCVGQRSCPGAS